MLVSPRGGFVHSHLRALEHSALFCQGPRGPALNVRALTEQAGFTDMRLNLDLDERNSPCAQSARMRRQQRLHMIGFERLIPPLAPPAGAQQMGGGGGSSANDSYYSSATLEADDDLAALAAHYAAQLEQAGWTRTDAGQSGPLAWHSWAFHDEDGEPWRGFFFILKTPGTEHEHFLYIRADLAQKRDWRRGGFSYARLS